MADIFYLIVIAFVILGIIGLLLYLVYNQYKTKHPGINCKKDGNVLWDDNCKYIIEKEYDSTIPSPKTLQLSVLDFTYSSSLGMPIYKPLWYRFRYVNGENGKYSDFSDWTQEPIFSGSNNLPYLNNTHNTDTNSCTYNYLIVGIDKNNLPFNPFTDPKYLNYYINVHRYISPDNQPLDKQPDKDVKDEIAGIMIPYQGQYYAYYEMENPCNKVACQRPTICQE